MTLRADVEASRPRLAGATPSDPPRRTGVHTGGELILSEGLSTIPR